MTAEKNYSSLVLSRPMNHIAFEASGERGSRPPVKRGVWLTSAKGGDPMSHGSVARSVKIPTEHTR